MGWFYRIVRNWVLRIGKTHINLHVGKCKPEDGWIWVTNPVDAIDYLQTYNVEKLYIEYDLGEDHGTGLGLCHWLEENPAYTPFSIRCKTTEPLYYRMMLSIQKAKAEKYGSETRHTYRKFLF